MDGSPIINEYSFELEIFPSFKIKTFIAQRKDKFLF